MARPTYRFAVDGHETERRPLQRRRRVLAGVIGIVALLTGVLLAA
jgi:hypothetical protein